MSSDLGKTGDDDAESDSEGQEANRFKPQSQQREIRGIVPGTLRAVVSHIFS